jgi:hypothetical protein
MAVGTHGTSSGRRWQGWRVAPLACVLWSAGLAAQAQVITGAPPSDKDCQVIRTCDFRRGAEVRGCLSSYSCRSCRFVPVCRTIAGQRRCEYISKCSWRGV